MFEMGARDSFSISVLKRILLVLDEQGPAINRTNLSVKSGLNYTTCVRYLDFLSLLGWISFLHNPPGHVSITGRGREFRRILIANKSPTDSEFVSVISTVSDPRSERATNRRYMLQKHAS